MYVAFMSQQAIEKLAKGIYTLYTDKEPPRSHNIWNIVRQIKKNVNLEKYCFDDNFEREMLKHKNFFAELFSYYISGRYPSYKDKISENIDANKASRILSTTEEVFLWLKSLSQYKK